MTMSFSPKEFGIDVLLPTGQNSPYLVQAVQSIINQDFADWIIFLLIDMGDSNSELVQSIVPASKLRIIEFEEDFNLSKRLNYGISLGTSQYIARMDSDDICDRNRFASQVHMLHCEGYSLVGSSAKVIDANGKSIGSISVNTVCNEIRKNLLLKNQFVHPSLMFKRDLMQDIQFNPHLIRSQDYGFILEVAKKFEICNSPDFLLSYRIHDLNHSNSKLSFKEMRILGKLKADIARNQGESRWSSFFWHSIWVFKNIFFSPARSLSLRIRLGKLKVGKHRRTLECEL